MKSRLAIFALAVFLLVNAAGCAPLLIGAAVGGVSIYAVSKDTIQGDTDKPYDILWSAALRVSAIRGTIKDEDVTRGYIELTADSSRVWIRLIRVTRATTRLKISARKYHLPNISLAQDIFVKIVEEAK